MFRKIPFSSGETYHVFNRGAHKQQVFTSEQDYFRFVLLLFLANHAGPVHIANLFEKYKGRSPVEVFEEEKPDQSLVSVRAYALMPNHYHIILQEKKEGGISFFMKKLMTAYAMYFNAKYDHSGVLFQGRFKSAHIDNDPYYRYIFSYVHLNPLDLIESGWEEKGIGNNKKQISLCANIRGQVLATTLGCGGHNTFC